MIGFVYYIHKPRCVCCDRPQPLGNSAWVEECCNECHMIWYDQGLTQSDQIGRYCLHAEKRGYFPFSVSKHMPRSEFEAVVIRGEQA